MLFMLPSIKVLGADQAMAQDQAKEEENDAQEIYRLLHNARKLLAARTRLIS